MFNNETGLYELDDWAMDPTTLWLVNDYEHPNVSRFYIIPTNDYGCEIEGGPDDEVLDQLNAFCQANENGQPTEEEYTSLGLESVSRVLWRFDTHNGYYIA